MKDEVIDKIFDLFLAHLDETGVTSKTLKFYKSDISHFTAWLLLRICTLGTEAENLTEAIPFLSKSIAFEYKKFLLDNGVAKLTTNRRLSALRNLSRFLTASQIMDFDFMEGLSNLSNETDETYPLLYEFKKYLKDEKISNNTIKSYLSDVKQFISWAEKQ